MKSMKDMKMPLLDIFYSFMSCMLFMMDIKAVYKRIKIHPSFC